MKQKVRVTVNVSDEFDNYGACINTLEIPLAKLIEKFGHVPDATLFVEDTGGGYHYDESYDYDDGRYALSVYYFRDETDEEYQVRLDREEKQRQKSEKAKVKRLLKKQSEKEAAQKEFERLKKTYGF